MAELRKEAEEQQRLIAEQQKPREKSGLLEDFGRSLVHSGLQTPVNALVQPVDRMLGTKILPNVQFIDRPQHEDFGTGNYWAQQGGAAIGMLGTFFVAGKAVKGFTRAGQSEAMLASTLSKQSMIGLTMKEATATGFVHDFAFRPLEEGDNRNYLTARLTNGAIGGATMFTLAGTGVGLKQLGAVAALEKSALVPVGGKYIGGTMSHVPESFRTKFAAPVLSNNLFGATISGAPAGFVSANMHSLTAEGRLATGRENFESMTTMSVIGAGFGGYHQFKGRHESGRSNFEWSNSKGEEKPYSKEFKIVGGEKALTEAIANVREGEGATVKVREHLGEAKGFKRLLGMQEFGPEKSLFIQHNQPGRGINETAARQADLLAICNLEEAMRPKAVVEGDTVHLRAGKDRINVASEKQQAREGEREPIRLGDPYERMQDNLENMRQRTSNSGEESSINDIVRQQLNETGLAAKGWKTAVTEKNSLMDMVGGDIIIFNEKTGEIYLLDCTEQPKTPPTIRQDGIIEIKKSWFRSDGRGEEMPDSFPREVRDVLMRATGEDGGAKPILNMRDITLPNIKAGAPGDQLPQLRRFIGDLNKLAADPAKRGDKDAIDQYSRKLNDTSQEFLEWAVGGSTNRTVVRSATDVARDSVIEYFISKRQPKIPEQGETAVSIKHNNVNPELAELRFKTTDGQLLNLGLMGDILDTARIEMLPLNKARAEKVEADVAKIRAEIKTRESDIEKIQVKRQKAETWQEFQDLNAELAAAREAHKKSVEALQPLAPESQLIARLKKAGRTVQEFNDYLMRDQSEIRNGGRVGHIEANKPGPLEQHLRNSLTRKSEPYLFRETIKTERPIKADEAAGLTPAQAKEFVNSVFNEWGSIEITPGTKDTMIELSLIDQAQQKPHLQKLREGYEAEIPEAIELVHRLLLEK
ncbi:MAG: hypothetical protein IAF58_03160 [Leptolyngbya sp.]|nr:hypothetical protein [Candidatus Melainabacteria bacterium]